MYLAMYDISGIQKFIFSTGKLKEQMGGSNIVHEIMYKCLPRLLGKENHEEWKNEGYKADRFSQDIKGNIVYIGGGNAMVLYEDSDTMEKINREMQKEVYKLTAGNIRLCYASIEIKSLDTAGEKYGEIYDELMKRMAIFKREHTAVSTVRGFSINAQDVNTLEPIIVNFSGKKKEVCAASIFQKHINKDRSMGKLEGYFFADQFDQYFTEGDKKSFLAIIHIDGNSMGKKIQKMIKSMDKDEQNTVRNSLEHMKKLSIEIDTIYENALIATLDKIYEKKIKTEMSKENPLPFRLVIRDGDDLTAVMEAGRALEFVSVYMEKLKEEVLYNKTKYPEITNRNMGVSAGAGIAFVHNKFPFDTAYDYAEQLCKSAKTLLKELSEKNIISEDTSCMDFQIIRSGMTSEVASYRKEKYTFTDENTEYKLHARPYFYSDNEELSQHRYTSFKNIIDKIISGEIARNKLKELRNSYSLGKDEAKNCYRLILSRNKAGISGDGIKDVFSNDNVAIYFDALDVIDLMEEENA